ncbi:hypothetical protein K1T71_013189 [Dendrolimus kikuchii]|uniref:Uncharacterized protein n=1 Tax=Dendrolimus kikuchii TaxID=765133 RepID=A0ACC1CJN3_9NEOP|nr:hypothetical protein K1T71_013189 [Dendrolimus kikuchii]
MRLGLKEENKVLVAERRYWVSYVLTIHFAEAPEEPYDTRPLYQRFEEQRLKKEAEYEEAHKLKNMIRGLDDDEVGFLDLVERTKAKAAHQISIEEQREMQEFRERVSNLAESEELIRLRAQLAPTRNTQPVAQVHSQKNKLQGVIVRKRKASEMDDVKQKDAPPPKNGVVNNNNHPASEVAAGGQLGQLGQSGALRCVGILPGLGHYDTDTSTDTDDSSDNDESDKCCVKRDMLGRRPEQLDKGRKDDEKS